MSSSDSTFLRALSELLSEIFNGSPGGEAYFDEAYLLNPGDPDLLRQLESVDARTASTRPMPGTTTVAAHVDHVHYGFTLLNRWADADWDVSWQRATVDDEQWRKLRDGLRHEAERWRNVVATRTDWNELTARGTLSSAAHTAYHLGAIRQILAVLGVYSGQRLFRGQAESPGEQSGRHSG